MNYTHIFESNDYDGSDSYSESFIRLKGQTPIVIATPFSVNTELKNISIDAHKNIGALAFRLHELFDVTVVTKSKDDPSISKLDGFINYNREVCSLVNKLKPCIFIDLQAFDPYYPADIKSAHGKDKEEVSYLRNLVNHFSNLRCVESEESNIGYMEHPYLMDLSELVFLLTGCPSIRLDANSLYINHTLNPQLYKELLNSFGNLLFDVISNGKMNSIECEVV